MHASQVPSHLATSPSCHFLVQFYRDFQVSQASKNSLHPPAEETRTQTLTSSCMITQCQRELSITSVGNLLCNFEKKSPKSNFQAFSKLPGIYKKLSKVRKVFPWAKALLVCASLNLLLLPENSHPETSRAFSVPQVWRPYNIRQTLGAALLRAEGITQKPCNG